MTRDNGDAVDASVIAGLRPFLVVQRYYTTVGVRSLMTSGFGWQSGDQKYALLSSSNFAAFRPVVACHGAGKRTGLA